MMRIDKTTYKIGDDNYHKIKTVKKQIIIGTSLRKNSYHITRLQHKEFGRTKKWNTYTITREGKVYQHYDNKYYSDFIGIKESDKKSVSIIIENMGCLFKSSSNEYLNWLNEVCLDENVLEKKWLNYKYWEKFTDEQINSLVNLTKQLCNDLNIPLKCVEFQNYHKQINKFQGIVFRGNYAEESNDINPLFNIKEFNESINLI